MHENKNLLHGDIHTPTKGTWSRSLKIFAEKKNADSKNEIGAEKGRDFSLTWAWRYLKKYRERPKDNRES